ncbi:MAG: hypothetical protein P1V97_10820 [Planctomycetota bacterium]|nr:hypothetical protein [Planctomycetota bacterium]
MKSSHGRPRRIILALAPTNAETLKGLGTWIEGREDDDASTTSLSSQGSLDLVQKSRKNSKLGSALEMKEAESEPEIEFFQRNQEEEMDLQLLEGELVVLGPANDPMRCRALPGERELRAFRMPCDGLLKLAPGVWFHREGLRKQPESEPSLEERSYADIFNMTFEVDESLPWEEPPKPVW